MIQSDQTAYQLTLSHLIEQRDWNAFNAYHENRLEVFGHKAQYAHLPTETRWQGQPTDTLAIVHERQGIGDTIQFLRYVPKIKNAQKVFLQCPDSLKSLLKIQRSWCPSLCSQLPPFDHWCPLLSLPSVLGISPPQEPYLQCQGVAELPTDKPAIGICNLGNPAFANDIARSVPLRHFGGLCPLANVYNLAVGPSVRTWVMPNGDRITADLNKDTGHLAIIDLADRLTDWQETAKVIQGMDWVISCDTALLHLAGAMGKRAIGILPRYACWRWAGQERSYWYPSVRLIRQHKVGAWREVFEEVVTIIRDAE